MQERLNGRALLCPAQKQSRCRGNSEFQHLRAAKWPLDPLCLHASGLSARSGEQRGGKGERGLVEGLLLLNGLQEVQGRLDFLLWVRGFHSSAGNGDVLPLRCHVVCRGDHADVDIWGSASQRQVRMRQASQQPRSGLPHPKSLL